MSQGTRLPRVLRDKHRRNAVALIAIILSAPLPTLAASTQRYPARPVRLIVPFAPGGSDVPGRMLALKLSERFGQPFVVDNRPGATGILGTDLLSKAPPDGYTLIFSTGSHTVTAVYYQKLPYDAIRDFTPVASVGRLPFVLLTHPSFPATTVKEFVAVAKAKPGQLNYGSAGTGGIGHLVHVLLAKQASIEITHIPYKGTGPAVTALLSGELNFYMPNLVGALPHVRSGKLRALGISADKRSPLAPDIPTIAEGGVHGVEASVWYGIQAPRATSPMIVDLLNREIGAILNTSAFRDQLAIVGVATEVSTPQQFASFIKTDMEKWRAVMQYSGMKQEAY
ncbi:MAG: tripartite tricarboxylate transporter substrate binding protein [Pseudomonadota bacterium]